MLSIIILSSSTIPFHERMVPGRRPRNTSAKQEMGLFHAIDDSTILLLLHYHNLQGHELYYSMDIALRPSLPFQKARAPIEKIQ